MAVALSGNMLGAGAEDQPIPGEPVASAPTLSDPEQGTGVNGDAAQSDASAPAQTAPDADSAPTGAEGSAGEQPAADDSPAQGTTATPAAAAPPAPPAAPAPAPEPAPAPAPAPAAAAAQAPAAPVTPPPLGAVAGPAGSEQTAQEEECPQEEQAQSTRRGETKLRGLGGGAATRDGGAKPATDCPEERPNPRRTSAPERARADRDDKPVKPKLRNAGGVPTMANPTISVALPGPVPVGVPNFFIDKFRIPPFLLPIYQAAGIQYGVRWEILAAINEIETDYGRNLNISSAGALGWMQFMPATWKAYGVDANRDGRKDPFNPVDAIFAAARYLRAAGASEDLRRAIFAYNHADWYVESVLMRARLIGGMPSDLVGSLTGLTQGHFPVYAKSRYADDLAERDLNRRVAAGENAAMPIESDDTRRGIDIFSRAGAPVIAVQDGEIVKTGTSRRLGRYVVLRDVFGNTYTYGNLKKVATHVPVPKDKKQSKASIAKELELPGRDPEPKGAASAGKQSGEPQPVPVAGVDAARGAIAKERLFAHPGRKNALAEGGYEQILESEEALANGAPMSEYFAGVYGLDPKDVVLKRMAAGRKVIAGTVLGRIGRTSQDASPHLHFELRPAGRGAPRIDPKPILDGWKLLESTAIYRARGQNPLVGGNASIGQILLMSKETLMQRVLNNPRIEIYSCGRQDIEAGAIDRRVLATLEFLAASGLKPTVTSLTCGHSYYTTSGNVSAHSSGNAIDIAKINGIPILGHQGEGSVTDITIRRLLTLQGTMKPNQIISLMTYEGTDNTLSMGDHADHIHVGFRPQYQPGTPDAKQLDAVLKPSQWLKLIDRLGQIDNPTVAARPSKYAIRVPVPRASSSHRGE